MRTAALATLAIASGVDAFITPSLVAPKAAAGTGLRMAASSADLPPLPINLLNPGWVWGEENYKSYVSTYKPNALVNRAYPIIDRVREKKLLTSTAESGLLSALADSGLTLSQTEKLLPLVEDSGILSFVANNADALLNSVGFLAVEPAELALPLVVAVVKGGPGLLNTVAASLVLAEVGIVLATQSPVLSAIAAVPLFGLAFGANLAAGALETVTSGAPIVFTPKADSVSSFSSSSSAPATKSTRPSAAKVTVAAREAVKAVAPKKVAAPKKALGNLKNLPKRSK